MLGRATLATLSVALIAIVPPSAAQPMGAGLCTVNPEAPPLDNRDGYFVNREEAPIHPMETNHAGTELWVANLVDGRISVFDIRANALQPLRIAELGGCLGPVTIRRRPEQAVPGPVEPGQVEPGQVEPRQPVLLKAQPVIVEPPPPIREMWVVCQGSDTVAVYNARTRRLKGSIRLRGEPTDLLFDTAGKFAYVSLAAVNQVVRFNANKLSAAPQVMEFSALYPVASGVQNPTQVHAEEPGSLWLDDEGLFVLSHMSGNGTFPAVNVDLLIDPPIAQQWEFFAQSGSAEPPDRDLFRFDPSSPTTAADAVLWRLGTLNFDVVRGGPSGEFYVSTIDLLNQTFTSAGAPTLEGEFDYLDSLTNPAKPAFALHGIVHAQPSSGNAPQTGPTTFVDLNDPANHHTSLPSSFRCATPNEMAITGSLLVVACYETRNLAVIDLATDTVVAQLGPPATVPAIGFGPRGVVIHPQAQVAYAYLRADGRLQSYDLSLAVGGATVAPAASVPIQGFDATPAALVAGRKIHIDAKRSANGLVTCNTCHMDGHLDGLIWDLSDFTGNTDVNPVGRFPKGSKVTMSLRGIEETPPFHWRGDRADLDAFNPAFTGLLGATQQLTPAEMEDFKRFVFSLSYPPNPNQDETRTYSPQALDGWDCFSLSNAHDVSSDAGSGLLTASCADCHAMEGASGTLNQVNNPLQGLLADDATQLRGLWDKASDVVDYVAAYGSNPVPFPYGLGLLDRIPTLGQGFANTGFTDSVLDFVNLNVFNLLPSGSQPDIDRLLLELDTGQAPTTAYAYTMNGSSTPGALPVALLTDAADVGYNDLIARGWVRNAGGTIVPVGMLWSTPNQSFIADDSTLGPSGNGVFTVTDLENAAAAGNGVFMLIGTPVGSGTRLGIDRDMDDLKNGDESATLPDNPDSDGDGYPDGYEVFWGSDPTLASSVPNDAFGPTITPNPGVSWTNSNVAKLRWLTDELATSRVEVWEVPSGGPTMVLVSAQEENRFKRFHSMVVRGLLPGRVYQFRILSLDPSGNPSQTVLANETMRSHLFASTHLTSTVLTKTGQNPDGTVNYDVTFTLVDEDQQPVGGASVDFTLVEWEPASADVGTITAFTPAGTTNAFGKVTYNITGAKDFSTVTGKAESFATLAHDSTSKLYFHSLDGQFNFWDEENVP